MADDPSLDVERLAADGDDVLEGVEPPTEAAQLEYLQAAGWPDADD